MKHTSLTTDAFSERSVSSAAQDGFSLVELLTVVGVIMVIAAVGGPPIANWARNYKIRGATQALAGDIQAARNRAITKNVNLGVAIVVQDADSYWTHTEDDQTLPKTRVRQSLTFAAPDATQSVRRLLPLGVQFALNAAECPAAPGFAATDYGLRFNRLGAWCDPGASAVCPEVTIVGPSLNAVAPNPAGGSTLCLIERASGLSRTVTVTTGGRVMTQQ
jgi:Tfp pilus assembly major pilin PilA